MADEEILNILKQGAIAWNQWKENNPDSETDFSGADLRGVNLQSANLQKATLRKSKLQFANLNKANLEEASLKGAKLQEANLQSANLRGANLKRASLLDCNLQYANMENADLREAQFDEEVLFIGVNLKGADLSSATGLNSGQINMAVTDNLTKLPEYFDEEDDDEFLTQF